MEKTFRELIPSDLEQIIKLNKKYGPEIEKINANKIPGIYDNCKDDQVSRFYNNLVTFTEDEGRITNIINDIDKLRHTGYVANLLNKMFEMVYKIYQNPEERSTIITETIKYHNDLVEYYLKTYGLSFEFEGNIGQNNNEAQINDKCTDKDTLYILVCKKDKSNIFDLNADFFDFLDFKRKSLTLLENKNKNVNYALLSQYKTNIWYVDKYPLPLKNFEKNQQGLYDHVTTNEFVRSFYSALQNRNAYQALQSLYNINLGSKILSGIHNINYLYETFVKQKPIPKTKNYESLKLSFPKVQIVTIIQKQQEGVKWPSL